MTETIDTPASQVPGAEPPPQSVLDGVYQALGLDLPPEPQHYLVRCCTIAMHIILLLLTHLWVCVLFVAAKIGLADDQPDNLDVPNVERQATATSVAGPSEMLAKSNASGIENSGNKSKRSINMEGDAKLQETQRMANDSDKLVKVIVDESAIARVELPNSVSGAIPDVFSKAVPREKPDNLRVEEKSHALRVYPSEELEEVRVMVGDIIRVEEEMATPLKVEPNELGKDGKNAHNKMTLEEQRRPIVTESSEIDTRKSSEEKKRPVVEPVNFDGYLS